MGNKKLKFVIGGLVIVAAIASLAFFAVRQNMVYYYTVSELQKKGPSQNVKVSGDLVVGTIKKGAVGEPITFQIHDKASKDKVIFVSYTGAVPDTFREPRPNEPAPEVVVTGDLLQQNKFAAVDLLAKCPSKYEAKVKEEAATGTTEQSGAVTPTTTP